MISGSDFIDVAGRIAARPASGEAEHRTAVSRAYYGAFHLAKAFVESLGIEVLRNGHDLHRWLSVNESPQAKLAGQKLSDLQSDRIRADYEISKDLARHGADPLKHVRLCVERAREVQSLLNECACDPLKHEVRTSLEQFLRSDPKQSRSRGTSSN
jgi:uncharacterized protein (UPF0332 family)